MTVCVCEAPDSLQQLLTFGPQPLCNRYLADPAGDEYRHPLVLGQCVRCGLVQLLAPAPAECLKPRLDWIANTEPEQHIPRLAQHIAALPDLTKTTPVCGVSSKDASLLDHLRHLGFASIRQVHQRADLGIDDQLARVETVQERLRPSRARAISAQHGRAGAVVLRHIVEHADHLSTFLEAAQILARPGGYLLIEVPDATRALEDRDYAVLWEEHLSYFSPVTLAAQIRAAGMELVQIEVVAVLHEDVIVATARTQGWGRLTEEVTRARSPGDLLSDEAIVRELERARRYAHGLRNRKRQVREWLEAARRVYGGVALLGAGHTGCMFVNLLEIADLIDVVVDDNSSKQGMWMPGSRLPIAGSGALLEHGIGLCLLSCSPDSEARVTQRNRQFLKRGGRFVSIYPGSDIAIPL